MIDEMMKQQIDEIFGAYEKPDGPGCAVGIMAAGEPVYLHGYGMADLDVQSRITADTVFHLASVSKQFTATCIALLEEAGEISLHDPVKKYIPFLPDYGHEINVGHLVYMTNGMEDFYDVTSLIMGIPEGHYFSVREAIRIIQAAHWLKFAPGEQWSYGNTGYFLLACIVEKVSGQPFDVFARKHVFDPLEMSHTFVRTDRFMDIPLRAKGYARIPQKGGPPASAAAFSFEPQNEMIEFGGAGQAWSNVNDLIKWETNFYNNRLGGKDSRLIEKMSQPGRLNDGTLTHYAYGQFISQRNGLKVVFHEGGAAGVNTVIYRVPEKKLSIICLANTSDFLTALLRKLGEECYERAAGIVLGWKPKKEKLAERTGGTGETKPAIRPGHSSARLELLSGNYEDPLSSHIWEVSVEGSTVSVRENYGNRFALEMEEVSEAGLVSFHSAEPFLNGCFHGSGGAFTEIEVRQGTVSKVFQRFLDPPVALERLKEYEGIYTCRPLGVSYRVQAAATGIYLENLNPANDLLNVVFTPTIEDMFLGRNPPLIGWYVIQFKRNTEGNVPAFCFRDEVMGRERWVFEKEMASTLKP